MYRIQHLLGTLTILLLLTGCTSFQAKEARRSIAMGLFETVWDGATDGLPFEKSAHSQYLHDIAERKEEARRKQEREDRHYAEEAESIMDAIDQAERQSGQRQPESIITDYERRQEERLSRRFETLEDQAEFDRFIRELETAVERNKDPRFDASLIIGSSRQTRSVIDHESTEKDSAKGQ